MIINPFRFTGGGGGGEPGLYVSGPFATNGATFPNYSSLLHPALYDSGSNRTYYAWEGWNGQRSQYVSWVDHDTGETGAIYGMGVSLMVDDDHGNPSIELDHEGHLWGAYGSHNLVASSDAKLSSTRWPISGSPADDGSLWAIRESLGVEFTYPKLLSVGSALYKFMREDINSPTAMTLVVFPSTALADGEVTWGTKVTLINWGTDTRCYQSNVVKVGTELHFLVTNGDYSDTIRVDVFYYIYETSDGSLSNWDKSTTIAAGSLPVDLTDSNANFRIFTHSGGNGGNVPSIAIGTDSVKHVLFLDGAGTSYALKHMYVDGGAWTTPETLDTLDGRFSSAGIGALADGKVEAVYAKDDDSLWPRDGNIRRRERSAAGIWAASQLVLTADGNALGQVNPVRNATPDARWTWCEIATGSDDSLAGGLNVYMWGARGLIGRNEATVAPPQATGNLLLDTDNLLLGTDSLTIDTTDD